MLNYSDLDSRPVQYLIKDVFKFQINLTHYFLRN